MAGNENIREIVYDMLLSVEKEHTPSHILLSKTLMKYQYMDKRDRALISRLFKGTLEWQIYLDGVIRQFSSVKWNKVRPPLRVILRLGAYQILKMEHIPDSAACNEAVKLAKARGFKNLSGFVNGVLRNVARHRDEIRWPDSEKEPAAWLSMKYSLPEWLTAMWLSDYDRETVAAMGEAMLAEQGTTVRVRSGASSPVSMEKLIEELNAAGARVEPGRLMPDALRLYGYDYLGSLGAFADGRLTVQDESAMLAASATGVRGGEYIIDVCAAPGGKSIHLADLLLQAEAGENISSAGMGGSTAGAGGFSTKKDEGQRNVLAGQVEARDLTEAKIEKIRENIRRTGLKNISVRVQDALSFCPEDEGKADIVMADLPCSGLGVMGRKPDIKLTASPESIAALAKLQREILAVVQRYVKPGGVLIYSTCTVSKAENEENMRWFAGHFPFELESLNGYLPEKAENEQTSQGFIQILPGQYGSDGFFIARFRRKQ